MAPRRDPAALLPLAPDALWILLALAAQPLHGYAIMRDVEGRSDGRVRLQTGALYRTLRRLLHDGAIDESARPPGTTSDDERRRYYSVTPFGRAVLDAEILRLDRLVRAARLAATGRAPRG